MASGGGRGPSWPPCRGRRKLRSEDRGCRGTGGGAGRSPGAPPCRFSALPADATVRSWPRCLSSRRRFSLTFTASCPRLIKHCQYSCPPPSQWKPKTPRPNSHSAIAATPHGGCFSRRLAVERRTGCCQVRSFLTMLRLDLPRCPIQESQASKTHAIQRVQMPRRPPRLTCILDKLSQLSHLGDLHLPAASASGDERVWTRASTRKLVAQVQSWSARCLVEAGTALQLRCNQFPSHRCL